MTTLSSAAEPSSLPRLPLALAGCALAMGIAVEILFHGHPIGISFPIWAALGVVVILLASRLEGTRPRRSAGLLAPAILLFAAVAAVRLEPLTVLLSMLATVLLFGLLVRTLLHGRLFRFGFVDLAFTWIAVPLESILRPWPTLGAATRQISGDRAARSRWFALLRGLLLALPILVVFVALLAAADLVFGDLVREALAWLDLDLIAEYVGRGMVVLVSGIFFLGALVTALRAREPRELIGEGEPLVQPFVGFIEAAVVLVLVNIVFAIFVGVQFQYLFGGEANIASAGYTYSEYARRGFGELVAVAFLSLGLILILGYWSRRVGDRRRWTFTGLSAVLVAMLGVILASAMMRLLLYEGAFGFTRLRTYTHIFIFWLAAVLVAFVVLLVFDRLRRIAIVTLVAGLGYVATLSIMNVDGFIADRNLERLETGEELDVVYLAQLSADALPTVSEWLAEADIAAPPELRAQLACQTAVLSSELRGQSWQSTHIGRQRAWNAMLDASSLIQGHRVWMQGMMWLVADPAGEETPCLVVWRD